MSKKGFRKVHFLFLSFYVGESTRENILKWKREKTGNSVLRIVVNKNVFLLKCHVLEDLQNNICFRKAKSAHYR